MPRRQTVAMFYHTSAVKYLLSDAHTMKTLPRSWSEFLAKKPETGMGYQVVAVTLRDGRRIEDIAIIQSSMIGEVRGHAGVPFEPDDITDLELTHRKWEFR